MDNAREPLAHLTTYTNISSYGMKPVMLSSSLRISDANSGGGAVAGHASPPALSPNLPSIVKMEPRLPSPCLNNLDQNIGNGGNVSTVSNGTTFSPSKRLRQEDGTWIPSPSQMSMGSLSPPPMVNGHSMMTTNGLSPVSMVSSYDPYSPKGKEDMSPPSSGINGCYGVDSFEAKKKKGPTPRQQEELCLVCGDRASGYHYNALTCEGCKGFFRRSITKNAVYQCKYGNNCEIDMYMRRKCQECRLKKCLSVGMRPECVVPEYQCAIKRESKRVQKEKDRPNSTTKDSPCIEIKEEKPSDLNPLRSDQEEVIQKLVFFQEEFESPSEDDFRKITAFPLGDTEEDSLKRFQHITEITILTVQLIVEFSKRVPGFDTLLREDQITLLKACSSEVMMLRTARKYDIKTDSIVFANNQPYTRENYRSASMGESADAIFHFCRKMCLMKVDNAEYALLTAIVIFSERPCLMEPSKVEGIQEFYIDTLRAYVDNHRLPGKNYFARLLSILTELRTLGNMNSELCFSLKVQNKKLPPFLAEIWDIQG
ncbi:ecdysone receptor-like isoform X1 [Centruroides sculpturatus]|uniref:ecdysone receptor-like isoform X1 n=1 Tax=Centruroides sculpturatus TaxID=218467 RepID=UPI000C6E52CC|nr:ecdysone receptor-like isoform X1 [Centruroides sculpturatus]XP_023219373.1 ecdysone receptor-like isoform X1 [Centruroides sculpturatus]